jgi:hypothetical protein
MHQSNVSFSSSATKSLLKLWAFSNRYQLATKLLGHLLHVLKDEASKNIWPWYELRGDRMSARSIGNYLNPMPDDHLSIHP